MISICSPSVEKTDKIGKRHYFFTNRHDVAVGIMVADERLATLRCDWHREKRPYTGRGKLRKMPAH